MDQGVIEMKKGAASVVQDPRSMQSKAKTKKLRKPFGMTANKGKEGRRRRLRRHRRMVS
jgi:hypothetical protein